MSIKIVDNGTGESWVLNKHTVFPTVDNQPIYKVSVQEPNGTKDVVWKLELEDLVLSYNATSGLLSWNSAKNMNRPAVVNYSVYNVTQSEDLGVTTSTSIYLPINLYQNNKIRVTASSDFTASVYSDIVLPKAYTINIFTKLEYANNFADFNLIVEASANSNVPDLFQIKMLGGGDYFWMPNEANYPDIIAAGGSLPNGSNVLNGGVDIYYGSNFVGSFEINIGSNFAEINGTRYDNFEIPIGNGHLVSFTVYL